MIERFQSVVISTDGACHVCGGTNLGSLLSLPDYPLNSLYLPAYDGGGAYRSDLTVHHCSHCLHFQAHSGVPTDALYHEGYRYTVNNAGAQNRQGYFAERVLRFAAGRQFNRVIELGCFDLSLLKKLKAAGIAANHWIGVDPVPLREAETTDGIEFINGYFQDVEIPHLNPDLADLVLSDQVFEHIPATRDVLAALSQTFAPDSLFILCVPSMELLVENFSFHNIIHEHLNYFSAATLATLMMDAGYSLRHSELNNDLTVGLLLQIYSNPRIPVRAANGPGEPRIPAHEHLLSAFARNLEVFRNVLGAVGRVVDAHAGGPMYGFGASDITGNLAYFMRSDFAELTNLVDDTPYKKNQFIPYLKPRIIGSDSVADWSNATVLITAPQANRPIINRLLTLKPRKIINPLNVF